MKIVKLILAVLVSLMVIFFAYAIFGNFSEGTRAGVVTKLSNKGYVIKTFEGTINQGGFSDASGTFVPTTWDFSVKGGEKDIIRELEESQLNGVRVKLYYKEKFIKFFWMGDTKYYVFKVEKMNSSPQPTGTNDPIK